MAGKTTVRHGKGYTITDRDLGWQDIVAEVAKAHTLEIAVGILEDAGANEDGTTIAEYAAYNEFGAVAKHKGGTRYSTGASGRIEFKSNAFVGPVHGETKAHDIVIPSRPFMRAAFDENVSAIAKDMESQGKAIMTGKRPARPAMTIIGQKQSDRIKNTITNRDFLPKLAPATIRAKKGSTKTLVDTGAMVNAVHPVVRTKRP